MVSKLQINVSIVRAKFSGNRLKYCCVYHFEGHMFLKDDMSNDVYCPIG
jgi:hypothetical protein